MEHYNLILIDHGERAGLNILQSDAYVALVTENPDLMHENKGDFYSDVSVDQLAQRIYDALNKEFDGKKLNAQAKVVASADFEPEDDSDIDYIVQEPQGVRLYDPNCHKEEVKGSERSMVYEWISLCFVEDLFSQEKEGSLQREVKEMKPQLEAALGQLAQAQEDLSASLRLLEQGLGDMRNTVGRTMKSWGGKLN